MHKKLSPAIFGIVLICFFLPWVNVSCQGQKVASFNGVQLATGTTVKEFGSNKKRNIKGEMLAVLSLLTAVAGLALSLTKKKTGTIGSSIAGGAGIVLLLSLKAKLDNDIMRESGGMLQANYDIGFYLTLVLFLSALGVNVYSLMQDKKTPLPQIKSPGDVYNFCSQCGAKVEQEAIFCGECGQSLKQGG